MDTPKYYILKVKLGAKRQEITPISVDEITQAAFSGRGLDNYIAIQLAKAIEYCIRTGRKPTASVLEDIEKAERCLSLAARYLRCQEEENETNKEPGHGATVESHS